MRNGCFFLLLLWFVLPAAHAQRVYNNASVLVSGDWYKIAVKDAGIYKIDLAFLSHLGINTSNLSSSSIRLFGNGGAMLPEACNGSVNDDLVENALQVVDGGDGIFNGSDYLLFYSNGTDTWTKDSVNHRFKHQKNLYSNRAYYYINIGAAGKRVQQQQLSPVPNTSVTSFTERWFHELDTVNFFKR